jgi:hypothetical protein
MDYAHNEWDGYPNGRQPSNKVLAEIWEETFLYEQEELCADCGEDMVFLDRDAIQYHKVGKVICLDCYEMWHEGMADSKASQAFEISAYGRDWD